MLYKVVRKDWGSSFTVPGTLLQPNVGDVFYGQKVTKELCAINPAVAAQSCLTQTVVMGYATVPITGTQVEFYFPTNYVRMAVDIGGTYITFRTLLVGAVALFVAYKLIKIKK